MEASAEVLALLTAKIAVYVTNCCNVSLEDFIGAVKIAYEKLESRNVKKKSKKKEWPKESVCAICGKKYMAKNKQHRFCKECGYPKGKNV